jgi:hypothetical protein
MGTKKNLGKVIGQVEGMRIRQIDKISTVKGKLVTKKTEIAIFQGKTQLESGFKNREVAIVRANEMKSQIVK